jgi:hypothetical protein
MKIGNFDIDIRSPGGIIFLVIAVIVALLVLSTIMTMTVGHLLLIAAAGGIGYVVGRGRR